MRMHQCTSLYSWHQYQWKSLYIGACNCYVVWRPGLVPPCLAWSDTVVGPTSKIAAGVV